jgi:thiazole synthase ThiGH ThiG subunit
MPMTIIDNTVTVAVQTTNRRTLLPGTIELARAAEQLVDAGFVGRGGERT